MNQEVAELVTLDAEPYPREIDLRRTGVVIIDMENIFLIEGAFCDLKGVLISHL